MNNHLKKSLEQNIIKINQEIEKFLPKKFDKKWLASIFGNTNWEFDEKACTEAIAKPVWNLLERGGKRWRPFLMQLSYEAVCKKKDSIQKFLILPELIHNGTLIIDDIEDNSELRRGHSCIHKLFGIDTAINAGNSLYYLPVLSLIKDTSLSNETKIKVYELLNKEMIKISFGQGMDIYWHKGEKTDMNENQYLQMCAYKTGALSRISAKLGVILGNGSEEQINAFGKFAESIGIAFQIQDDILNITSKKIGKEFGEDLTENKKTLMVIKTLEKAGENDKIRLLKILNLKTKDEKLIKEAIEIMEKYHSLEYAKSKAKRLVIDAWNKLAPLIKDSEAKKKLKLFANYLIKRDR